MERINIREEMKQITDSHFDFEFETKEVPMKRSEFIDVLETEFTRLFKTYRNYFADVDKDDKPDLTH